MMYPVHQMQTQPPVQMAQFNSNLMGYHQPTTGYQLPTHNTNQLPQSMNYPPLIGGMWPPGFPPPQIPISGYQTPNHPPPTTNSTPSSGGFAQGERRTSFDPTWSPSFVS